MQCKWKRIWKRRHGADLTKDQPSFSQQQSPSLSAVYERTVRTNSYNDFVMKIDVFTGTIRAHGGNVDVPFSLHASGLLDPNQEAVDDILQAQMDIELPEMMSMAMEFFENSHIASTLCATLLQSIDEASDQCSHMEVLLAGLPHSGEALGFMQQQLMVESLSEMVKARNPFAGSEASEMFADVAKRYGDLGVAVEVRRKVVGRKVRGFRRWRAGCAVVVVAVVVGATVVAVVVATHMAVTMATVPFVAVAAAVVRSKSMKERNSRQSEYRIEKSSRSISTGADAVGTESANARPTSGQKIRSRMAGGLSTGADDIERRGNLEGAGTSRIEVESGTELRSIEAEMGSSGSMEMGGREADMGGGAGVSGGVLQMSSLVTGGVRTGGAELEEAGGSAEASGGSGAGMSGVRHTGAERSGVRHKGGEMGGGREAERRRQCWCGGLGKLRRQSAKLDALARGSFTVNRMLDTLRCLVTGLQDDVERTRKLVEFGWSHREEAKCVQQVGKQLFRSHSHMIQQLANLHEQVVVCFLIINKARDIVLQEFSPSPLQTSCFW